MGKKKKKYVMVEDDSIMDIANMMYDPEAFDAFLEEGAKSYTKGKNNNSLRSGKVTSDNKSAIHNAIEQYMMDMAMGNTTDYEEDEELDNYDDYEEKQEEYQPEEIDRETIHVSRHKEQSRDIEVIRGSGQPKLAFTDGIGNRKVVFNSEIQTPVIGNFNTVMNEFIKPLSILTMAPNAIYYSDEFMKRMYRCGFRKLRGNNRFLFVTTKECEQEFVFAYDMENMKDMDTEYANRCNVVAKELQSICSDEYLGGYAVYSMVMLMGNTYIGNLSSSFIESCLMNAENESAKDKLEVSMKTDPEILAMNSGSDNKFDITIQDYETVINRFISSIGNYIDLEDDDAVDTASEEDIQEEADDVETVEDDNEVDETISGSPHPSLQNETNNRSTGYVNPDEVSNMFTLGGASKDDDPFRISDEDGQRDNFSDVGAVGSRREIEFRGGKTDHPNVDGEPRIDNIEEDEKEKEETAREYHGLAADAVQRKEEERKKEVQPQEVRKEGYVPPSKQPEVIKEEKEEEDCSMVIPVMGL